MYLWWFKACYIFSLDIKFLVQKNISAIGTDFAIRKEKSNKMQQCIKIFIFPYLYEAQHVVGDTRPLIRSLKRH
jgi:hypothetical protein